MMPKTETQLAPIKMKETVLQSISNQLIKFFRLLVLYTVYMRDIYTLQTVYLQKPYAYLSDVEIRKQFPCFYIVQVLRVCSVLFLLCLIFNQVLCVSYQSMAYA